MESGTTTNGMSDTTSTPPSTTTPPVTTVEPDSSAGPTTDEPEMCDPACEPGQCCTAGACFSAPDPVCPGGCAAGEVCMCPEGSDPCDCEASCMSGTCGVDGSYDPCANAGCPAGSVCFSDDPANPTITWCAAECANDCECPFAPEGTTAQCDMVGSNGMHCFVTCEGGAPCPEGMICAAGRFCAWEVDFEPSPQFDDCINNDGECPMGQVCISDNPDDPSFGWCADNNCADDTECEPAPATGDAPAECAEILAGGGQACILNCADGATCPDGMICVPGPDPFSFCVWEALPDAGFGECALGDCLDGEACLDGGMDEEAWSVCSQECTEAADCDLPAPATGDAPVVCGDPTDTGTGTGSSTGGSGTEGSTGGSGTGSGSGSGSSTGGDVPTDDFTCYLDCSGGQTCPDGMECIDDSWCAWPAAPDMGSYPACPNIDPGGTECLTGPGDGNICLANDLDNPDFTVCSTPCNGDADCPETESGDAVATCDDITGDGDDECIVDCTGGLTCPNGMVCAGGANICVWPV